MNVQLPMVAVVGTGSLLSPPSSPQMSGRPVKPEFNRQSHGWKSRPTSPAVVEPDDIQPGKLRFGSKPPVNHDRGLTRTLGGSNVHAHRQQGNIKEESEEVQHPFRAQNQIKTGAEKAMFGENLKEASGDLYPRFIPDITVASAEDDLDDDEEYAMTTSDLDETPTEGGVPKTAAEERADKRKMKRFRWGNRFKTLMDIN